MTVCRDFTPADQVAVRALVLDGLRERWGPAFDAGFNSDLDDIIGNYVSQGAEVVVIDVAGRVAATGTLRPEPGDRGRIVRMSVARERRREGLGRAVVDELIERARRRGMAAVVVMTDTPWSSAVALYRACGFAEVGRDNTDTHFAMTLDD